MLEIVTNIFNSDQFIPHGHCYLWKSELVSLHLLSDAFIAIAYFSIPLTLIYFINKRKDVPFSFIFILFSAFIISCGLTHVMGVWTLWYPSYWLSGFIKAITAIISVWTALELFPVIPQALALPSPEKLNALNQQLAIEIKERKEVEAQILKLNKELESRVLQRTSALKNVNKELEYKIKLEKLVAVISSLFISIKKDEFESSINIALQKIKDAFDVDNCGLFLGKSIAESEKNFYLTINNSDIRSNNSESNWQEHLSFVLEKNKKSLVFKINNIEKVKNKTLKEEAYIKDNNIQSLISVPLIYDSSLQGVLMLNTSRKFKKWRKVDLVALKVISEIFVSGLQNFEMQERLKKWNEELRRSNQELEQFAYVASHDLQEPLRTITSFSELLELEYKDKFDEDGQQYLTFLVDASSRMKMLIQDLLALSRLKTKANKFTLVDCNEVIKEILEDLQVSIQEKKAVIEYGELPFIMGDKSQILQLWQNLISNALKFHSDKIPEIKISATLQKNQWLFSIQDNGIGIESKYRERIFVIFQRLHTRNNYKGTGIGLALCKKIVARHGGKIWVESKLDHGSTFLFTIPKPVNQLPNYL